MIEENNLEQLLLTLASKTGCFTKKQIESMFKTRSLNNIEKTIKTLYRKGAIHATRENTSQYYFGKKENLNQDTIKAIWAFISLIKGKPDDYINAMLEPERPASISYMINNSYYNIVVINSENDIGLINIMYQRTIELSDEATNTDELYKWVLVYTDEELLTKPLDSRMTKLKVFLDFSLDENRPQVLFAKD